MANNIIITGVTGFVGKNIFLNESITDDIITSGEPRGGDLKILIW